MRLQVRPDRTMVHILGTQSSQLSTHSPLAPLPCLSRWVLGLMLAEPDSQLPNLSLSTSYKRPSIQDSSWVLLAERSLSSALALYPSKGLWPWGQLMSSTHPITSLNGATQWLFLPWAGSVISHPAGNSVGTLPQSYPVTDNTLAQRLQSLRGCPSANGVMIIWGGETNFQSWGITFSLSTGFANCAEALPGA